MAHLATGSVARQLESLFDGSSVAGMTDRELLDRYTARRAAIREPAFSALVARHGPMVLGVCRQVLGDRHHAEDAFQAVFLVLASKARSIRNADLLGSWLYGVALRTAHREKARLVRVRRNEEGDAADGPGAIALGDLTASPADVAAMAREHAEILHDEVARLPKPFRSAIVLCYFEGIALDEAARRLRWPAGTLRSRLARARDRLRRRLTRRGVFLPSAALAVALSPRAARALVSPHLCATTARAALNFAAGEAAGGAVSNLAAALAREVLRSMLHHNLIVVALTVLLLGAVAGAAGFLTRAPAMKDAAKSPPRTQLPQGASHREPGTAGAAPGRMLVTGRVLDPVGKPIANATVMVHAGNRLPGQILGSQGIFPVPIGHAGADGTGRFCIDALRTSAAAHHRVGAVAIAPGYGAGWTALDPDAEHPAADITLIPEQVIHGRLFDLRGQPARDVTVTVRALQRLDSRKPNVRDRVEGPVFTLDQAKDLPAWPRPAITDADGRFTLRGAGRGIRVALGVDDMRFAPRTIPIDTDGATDSKPLTIALEPAKIITGLVTYGDTHKPVPHARLTVAARSERQGGSRVTDFQADAEGHYRANPEPRDRFYVSAYPPDGQPYLSATQSFAWPKGAIEHSVDLALPRGILIRGHVTEEGSGKPVAGAAVQYSVHSRPGTDRDNSSIPAATSADGSFALAVPPKPGHLAIRAPSDDYVSQEIGNRLLFEGQPGGRRLYSHAFIACDPIPGNAGLELHVVVRRGTVIQGRVIGPDGQPVHDAWLFSRVILRWSISPLRSWTARECGHARGGRFALHGIDLDSAYPVYFLEPSRMLGATAQISGKSAGGPPVVVGLQPCGAAKARLVNADGKPIAMPLPPEFVTMIVTPGQLSKVVQSDSGQLLADEAWLSEVDPVNHANALVSDAEGRIEIPVLIPGATYRIIDRTTVRDPGGPQLRKEFQVRSGEMLDLGDIRIEKPQ